MSPQFRESDVLASICRDSFYHFVREFWDVVIPETPVWNWHIKYLCDELQEVAEWVFAGMPKKYDLVINIPPGTTKSTIASIMLPAWCWTRMPSCRFLGGSYAYDLALDFSRKTRNIITSEKYEACFPDVVLREDQNTKGYFANTLGGLRNSAGVGGAILGKHFHLMVVDDPLSPLASLSDADLKTANVWMGETLSQRKVDKRVTVTILIMQRLHQEDPSGVMLGKTRQRVRHVCLPCDDSWDIQPPELKEKYTAQGGLLDPVRLPREVLDDSREDLGEAGYAGQCGQSPIPRGGQMFKVDKLNYSTHRPPAHVLTQIVRFWDNAATSEATSKHGCYTVGTEIGVEMRNGKPHFWILDVVRGRWETHTRRVTMKQTAVLDGKTVRIGIEEEGGSAGKDTAADHIAYLAGFRVVSIKPTGDKVTRADAWSSQVNGGNVTVVIATWTKAWVEEHRFFPDSKFKDQVDSASGGFGMVTKRRIRVGAL
jgi:predicted phage terminase large subunit-like protein